MRAKSLFWLLVLAAVAVGLGVWLQKNSREREAAALGGTGQTLLPGLDVNRVEAVTFTTGTGTFTVRKQDGGWGVAERWGYPADYAAVSRFLLALGELKATQTLAAGESQFGRLGVKAPGPDEGCGTEVRLQSAGGKDVSLILGKSIRRGSGDEDAQNPLAFGGAAGRYIRLPTGGLIAIVARDLGLPDLTPAAWLDPEFLKVADVRMATLEKEGRLLWTLRREKAGDALTLADAAAGETLDEEKTRSLANALAWIRFSDVAGKADAKPAPVLPWRYTVTDFDGLTVTLQAGEGTPGKEWRCTVSVAWQGAETRVPAAGEKPEDKAKLDAEFAKKQADNRQRAEDLQRRLAGWVYVVDKFALDAVFLERAALLKAPEKAAPAPEGVSAPAVLPPG